MDALSKRRRLVHRKERILKRISRYEDLKNKGNLSEYGWHYYGFFSGVLFEIEDQIDIIDEELELEKIT